MSSYSVLLVFFRSKMASENILYITHQRKSGNTIINGQSLQNDVTLVFVKKYSSLLYFHLQLFFQRVKDLSFFFLDPKCPMVQYLKGAKVLFYSDHKLE